MSYQSQNAFHVSPSLLLSNSIWSFHITVWVIFLSLPLTECAFDQKPTRLCYLIRDLEGTHRVSVECADSLLYLWGPHQLGAWPSSLTSHCVGRPHPAALEPHFTGILPTPRVPVHASLLPWPCRWSSEPKWSKAISSSVAFHSTWFMPFCKINTFPLCGCSLGTYLPSSLVRSWGQRLGFTNPFELCSVVSGICI